MKENIWTTYDERQLAELNEISEKYKECLNAGKTERECVELSIRMAEEAGYRNISDVMAAGKELGAGDKVYAVNMNKMLALFRIGEEPISGPGIPGYALLRRHQEIPVGGAASLSSRCDREKRRNDGKGQHRRG